MQITKEMEKSDYVTAKCLGKNEEKEMRTVKGKAKKKSL